MKFEVPFLSGKNGYSDGKAGDEGQFLFDGLHGKYYQVNRKYSVFSHAPTPLGLAIPIYTDTALAGAMPIWNPAGSGYKVVLAKCHISRVSGTAAVNNFGLYARNGVGSVTGTGQQITAFADTVPINGQLGLVNSIGGTGGGPNSKVKSSRAGTVTVTAGVAAEFVEALCGSGVEANATTNGISLINHDFDGRIEVYPGTIVWVASVLASVALYMTQISWYEVPISS